MLPPPRSSGSCLTEVLSSWDHARSVTSTTERRVLPLDDVRADGWFERLGEGSNNFKQLCNVVGNRFVAFSVIAGVRVTALTVDWRAPDATLVDFIVGEEPDEQRLPLGEFRRRLGAALVADEPLAEELPEDPSPEDIQAFIGFRYVLLSPIFGIALRSLALAPGLSPMILIDQGRGVEELTVEALRELIHMRIRSEVERHRPSTPFSLDLSILPKVDEAAEASDWERCIDLLGAWPGPLSLLLRTAEGQRLTPDVRGTLAHSLGLLGTAYAKTGRHEWAEEVMRLGIQWSQDGPAASDLFRRLGEAHVERGRHGQAIGLLRRSLALGAREAVVMPLLATCYAERGKWVAAAACVDDALAAGAAEEVVATVRAQAMEQLGDAWERFRQRVPMPKPTAKTLPPPADE